MQHHNMQAALTNGVFSDYEDILLSVEETPSLYMF